jgi:hypothetical protein
LRAGCDEAPSVFCRLREIANLAQLDDDTRDHGSDPVAECGMAHAQPPGNEVTRMRNGFLGLLVGGVLVLATGCGGGGTTSSTAAASAAPAAESSGTGVGSQPSAQASAAGPASEAPAGGGGGTAAGVCELVTADEVAGIFGVPSVTMSVVLGPPDNCIVQDANGNPLTAWSLTTVQASALYSAFTVDPSTIAVSGIGDKAAIVQNTGLMVLKGGSLLVVSISSGSDMSADEATQAAKQVGALAAGRM